MTIKVYRDDAANAIYFENQLGAQFLNNLQASVPDLSTGLVHIKDKARDLELVTAADHSRFVDEGDVQYGQTATDACDALNAIFSASGTASGNPPEITSSLTVNSTQGETINYELTSNYGVAYEWSNLPTGLALVEGNNRKLVGGSLLSAGTYTVNVTAINYFGQTSESIDFVVSAAPYSNTKSVRFNNADYLGGNAALVDGALGRASNGSGAGDAWCIAFSFKPGTASNQNQTIFYYGSNNTSNEGYIQIKYNGASGEKRLTLRYGSNNNLIEISTPVDSAPSGTWSRFIYNYDGGTTGSASGEIADYYSRFTILKNGIAYQSSELLQSNSNYGYSGNMEGMNFRVGKWANGQTLRNNSFVDELAIWSSDQSANFADIYNGGVSHDMALLDDSPAHFYRFGDGDSYPTIQDNSGSVHLVMYNMTASDIVNDVP